MIIRLGLKSHSERINQDNNKSSPLKPSYNICQISFSGCCNLGGDKKDYNYYRTNNKKINGSNDRSISILTTQNYDEINKLAENYSFSYGDLGENITFDNSLNSVLSKNIKIKIGKVILEITEPIKPCYRLGYINNNLDKNWWRANNNSNISNYINISGNRGWYCKVISEGDIKTNDSVIFL